MNIIERDQKSQEAHLKHDLYCTSRHTKKRKRRRGYADNRYGH
jgi:hypothetical protein